jgi:glutathione S-transferase
MRKRKSTLLEASNARPAIKINPLERVPVLLLDSGEPLGENTAILPYLGKRFNLWPIDTIAEAKALSLIGFFAASVHPAHAHISRPERYAFDTTAFPTLKETGLKTFHGFLKQIDGVLAEREWFSDRYSVLDPYGFVFYTWGVRRDLPMGELRSYTAFKGRMLKRPAVARVLDSEQIKVWAAASEARRAIALMCRHSAGYLRTALRFLQRAGDGLQQNPAGC